MSMKMTDDLPSAGQHLGDGLPDARGAALRCVNTQEEPTYTYFKDILPVTYAVLPDIVLWLPFYQIEEFVVFESYDRSCKNERLDLTSI